MLLVVEPLKNSSRHWGSSSQFYASKYKDYNLVKPCKAYKSSHIPKITIFMGGFSAITSLTPGRASSEPAVNPVTVPSKNVPGHSESCSYVSMILYIYTVYIQSIQRSLICLAVLSLASFPSQRSVCYARNVLMRTLVAIRSNRQGFLKTTAGIPEHPRNSRYTNKSSDSGIPCANKLVYHGISDTQVAQQFAQ